MKDGIIKGQGNSRFLKAPETIPTTFAEFRTALINGTLPVDVLFNAVGWDVIGTALNKANLLTDTVAMALGLTSEDPTVNEAINALLAVASPSKNGMMSKTDKAKLDGVANNANNYSHPTGAGNNHIPSGGNVDSILGYSASGLAIWIQQLAQNSILSAATATAYGLEGGDANVDKALKKVRVLKRSNYKTFVVPGSFIVPDGVNQIKISGCAAGGNGSDTAPGKAGEYLLNSLRTVTPGSTLSITVGAGNTVITGTGISITLLANTLTSNYPNDKLGIIPAGGSIPPTMPGSGLNLSEAAIKELPYPELFLNYPFQTRVGTAYIGGMITGASVSTGSNNSLYGHALLGFSGLGDKPGIGGAFGAGGSGQSGNYVGGSAGGFGAGGGQTLGGWGTPLGSPGFVLIEW